MTNATARFLVPTVGREATSPLGVVVSTEAESREVRGLLTRTSMGEEYAAIGHAATDMWRLRVADPGFEPQTGWIVEIRSDGDERWIRHSITRTSCRLWLDLILRRTPEDE